MKRLSLIIPFVTLVLVISAVGCGSNAPSAPNVDATVAAAVAATRTASDVEEKIKATLNAPISTPAPRIPTAESASNAIDEYTKAIQLDPNDMYGYYNRGHSYATLGQHQAAINDYTKAIQLDPDYAFAYSNRGIVYRNLGQTANADADKTMACSLDSKYC